MQNPFIDIRYHDWYGKLGYDELARLKFDERKVEQEYSCSCNQIPIEQECRKVFKTGGFYTKAEVKRMLQNIYDNLGFMGRKAKSTELGLYLNVKERMIKDDKGNRKEGYEILP